MDTQNINTSTPDNDAAADQPPKRAASCGKNISAARERDRYAFTLIIICVILFIGALIFEQLTINVNQNASADFSIVLDFFKLIVTATMGYLFGRQVDSGNNNGGN